MGSATAQSKTPRSKTNDASIEIADAQLSLIQNTFVASPIAGVVAEVFVSEGDEVEVNRPMVQLDDEQVRTERDAAQGAYEAARLKAENDIDARYAKRTLEVRSRELDQSREANRGFAGAISDTEIAKLQLVVDQAELAIEQAEHELQIAAAAANEKLAAAMIAEARLIKHGIEAPVSGQVAEVVVEPGEWVEAGKPVVRLIKLDPIRVECFVDGNKHGCELIGRAVRFAPSGANAGDRSARDEVSFDGTVTYVSPELHPVTGQARLWATLKNPNRSARAGMRGRLVILPGPSPASK